MHPTVSIIVPCYNEQATIRPLLTAIYEQTYARAEMEVIIADGMSTDGTRAEIAAFADAHADLEITVVDNPKRIIPAALNQAIKEARGEILVRLDGHSMPYPDYVERCVADLEAGLGENVGGIWEIRPACATWLARSIAVAAAHPLGVGDALYRHATKPAYVDTVPFGAFKRELLALIGFFDENLLTNEDYEFNVRVRMSGGRIWLNPDIRSVYIARGTLRALASQYFRYGFWKWRMIRRYPGTLRWRQALPPLFVAGILGGTLLTIAWPIFGYLLAGGILLYTLALTAAGLQAAGQHKRPFLAVGLPLAVADMHIAWGAGFLWGMIKGLFTTEGAKRQ
ncbi:MAG: glycosyltransferase family 2 protein [Anaerolineales bacterium]|nr:glycosyltransferase family 2 protein [Anaerolineales bacterium]